MAHSLTGAAWALKPADPDTVRSAATRASLSEIAARCLILRFGTPAGSVAQAPQGLSGLSGPGWTDLDWLDPDLSQLHDPLAMKNMGPALERLDRAIAQGERVRVVTDYDVDGTTSSLILQAALRFAAGSRPGADISYHIPDRFHEGYGFSVAAADAAADAGVRLVVTADIGVRDHAAVQRARERGLDVLICDHHLPEGAAVPGDATVLCPPQQGCAYPNPSLAACGISLKVAQALLRAHPQREKILRSLLKLAAIGTVADMVPLTTPENRAIVALGLRELNRGGHGVGLEALLRGSGLSGEEIRESHLGFRIGPRINAAGRVADARLIVNLLNTRDPAEAAQLAGEVERLNGQRQEIQKRLVTLALARVGVEPDPFVVVAGPEHEGWHRGVVGIVASRLKDEVNRPVAVVSIQGERAVGSVRSTPAVHAVHALDTCADLLERYGGHPAAAGFTVPLRHLDTLRERLCAYAADHLGDAPNVRVHEADAEVRVPDLTDRLRVELDRLGPFGQGNPRPLLLVRGVRLQRVRPHDKGQVTMELPHSHGAVEGIWWNHREHAPALSRFPVDLLGELEENRWQGKRTLRLNVKDARVCEPDPA